MTALSSKSLQRLGVILITLLLAYQLSRQSSEAALLALIAALFGLGLLRQPVFGIGAIIFAAIFVKFEISTGSEVKLNAATILIPILSLIWLLRMVRQRELTFRSSRTNKPLAFLLISLLISLIIGQATWNTSILQSNNFVIVQLAQWSIFVFSAAIFWLCGNLVSTHVELEKIAQVFLVVGGVIAILMLFPPLQQFLFSSLTIVISRAPFWMVLTALAGGQLLFGPRDSSIAWRIFLAAVVLSAIYFSFITNRESSSSWMGVGAALAILLWLRTNRLRLAIVIAGILLIISGSLFDIVWSFAGGDVIWFRTGGSRLALIERVIEVTLSNPIFGLGPAAYRLYANATPLTYAHITWFEPRVSSHNNFVDIFSHGGLVALFLFFWFVFELSRISLRLRTKFFQRSFASGYVNGVLATVGASLVLMLFADWILPFVYNIGFPGFQASVLVWLFFGGLIVLEHVDG